MEFVRVGNPLHSYYLHIEGLKVLKVVKSAQRANLFGNFSTSVHACDERVCSHRRDASYLAHVLET